MSIPEEPTHKRVAIRHRTDNYGMLVIYGSLSGGRMSMSGDVVVINGHTLTSDELQRGWYDGSSR